MTGLAHPHRPRPPAPAHRQRRAIAAAGIAAGAATVVITDDQPAPRVRTITAPNQPATGRYFDIEAYNATGMRALGHRISQQQTNRTPRHPAIEPKMARLRRGR